VEDRDDNYSPSNGGLVANDWADLTGGETSQDLRGPILLDEFGKYTGGGSTWANVAYGSTFSEYDCNGWTSNSHADTGAIGVSQRTYHGWSWDYYDGEDSIGEGTFNTAKRHWCDYVRPIYCFEQ
jgi:hypothetical protein